MARFTFVQLLSLVFMLRANGVQGDRRGAPCEERYLARQSFSSQEQALFGRCSADDCILGPTMTNSYFQVRVDQVVPVKQSHPIDKEISSDSQTEGSGTPDGFGRTPSFISHN